MSSHTAGRRTRHAIRGSARMLFGLEAMIAVLAAAGGVLLIIKPDGSLMDADLTALAGSPFHDWRLPGVLLVTLVAGGFTVAAIAEWAGWRIAPAVSIAAGLGLVAFELFEVSWLGFQSLELLFALVGVTVVVLAADRPGHHTRGDHR